MRVLKSVFDGGGGDDVSRTWGLEPLPISKNFCYLKETGDFYCFYWVFFAIFSQIGTRF